MNIKELLTTVEFVDGKKNFKGCDSITSFGKKIILKNNKQIDLSIIIPIFYRFERLFIALNCLLGSIKESCISTEIILIDNSIEAGLCRSLLKFFSKKTFINVLYYHDPFLNQSGMRNLGLKMASPTSKFIGIIDSDIFLSTHTIKIMTKELDDKNEIMAVSPPLTKYYGGKHNATRSKCNTAKQNNNLLMPSSYYIEHGMWYNSSFLETLMLRGVFFIKRELFKIFPDPQNPWLIDFTVWQNVPFFLTIKEKNKLIGYKMDKKCLCLHDERLNPYTISSSMNNWQAETIKSILLLFYRNSLFEYRSQRNNHRFLETIHTVLNNIFKKNTDNAIGFLQIMAKYLSNDFEEGVDKLNRLNFSQELNHLTKVKKIMISSKLAWYRMQEIKSLNIKKPM